MHINDLKCFIEGHTGKDKSLDILFYKAGHHMPNDAYGMYTKEFLSDPKEGDFDHKALIVLTKNGDIVTSWKPKYYDLRGDDTPPKEISEIEFYRREAEAKNRKENENE